MKLILKIPTLLVVAFCLTLIGCVHTAEPIQAWIISAENGQPIEHVVVVAHWQMKGGMEGGNDVGQLMVMEARTDDKGRFAFPGWGPKIAWAGNIKWARPELLIFKTAYKPLALSNYPLINDPHARDFVLKSEWNGKTIKLAASAPEAAERLIDFALLDNKLHTVIGNYKACEWKKIPNMLREVRRQRLVFTESVPRANIEINSVDQDVIGNAEAYAREGWAECGSPKKIFE